MRDPPRLEPASTSEARRASSRGWSSNGPPRLAELVDARRVGHMYFVYILKSQKDNKYYIGQTDDISARIRLHNNGLVKSTKARRPFIIIRTETFSTRGEARKRENYLKRLKGGNEFRKIIN